MGECRWESMSEDEIGQFSLFEKLNKILRQ